MRAAFLVLALMAFGEASFAVSAHAQACAAVQDCGDVNDSGGVTASDALTVLNRAVGLPVTVTCECESTGETTVSQTVRTGQSTCFDVAGATISCAGTGQDGEIQAGSPRSFTDNLDGTVKDNATCLMWEKHGDDDSIHDYGNTYTWTDAVGVKIATLNSTSFAGHTDWRVPNRFELDTLLDLGTTGPATYSAYNNECAFGNCAIDVCSCTANSIYWTSTSNRASPAYAWSLNFSAGDTTVLSKTEPARIRAVRSLP